MPSKAMLKEAFIKKRWIILTALFGCAVMSLSSWILYRELYVPKSPHNLKSRYGFLFQPVRELSDLEQIQTSLRRFPVNKTLTNTSSTCSLECHDTTDSPYGNGKADLNGRVVLNDDISVLMDTPMADDTQIYNYHGCCRSYQKFIDPDRLPNVNNEMRRLIQFKNERQYFMTDVCSHVSGCQRRCRCEQQEVMAWALVVDDDHRETNFDPDEDVENARVELVKFPGWCKCFNQ